jgi:Hint domain
MLPHALTGPLVNETKGTAAMFMQDLSRFTATPVNMLDASLSLGVIAGTLVETVSGWRSVEDIRVGEMIQTLDGGAKRVVAINRREILPGEAVVEVKGGCFDACSDVLLMPRQGVLLDTVGLMGALYARVPATALTSVVGALRKHTQRREEVVTPIFEEEEVIWAQSGMLLHCPGIRVAETAFPELHADAAELFVLERARLFV